MSTMKSGCEDGVGSEPLNPELVIVKVKEEHDFEEEPAIKNELSSADEMEASNTDGHDAGLSMRRFGGEKCVKEEEIFVKSEFGSCARSDDSALVDNNDEDGVCFEPLNPELVVVEVKEEHDFEEEPAIKNELSSAHEEEASNTDRQDAGLTMSCARSDDSALVDNNDAGEKPYPCKLCNYKTTHARNLSRHMKTHVPAAEKPYACDWCSFRTADLSNINAHKLSHTGEKPYPCKLCNYKAAHPRNLSRHMKTHTGEKPHACDWCSFRTADLTSINAHKLTHTGEKPYSCNLCNYKATQPGNLARHMRTHTGEKPYACDRCTFRAADVTSINIHKLTHTGEKPYSCKLCDYKAVNPGNLSRHMRTHTGEKPYSCKLCDYKAAQPGHLARHMRTHTGEKPFKCPLCVYSCKRKRCLTKHMIQTHPEAPPLPFRMSQRSKTTDSIGSSNSSKGQRPAGAESISSDTELDDEPNCKIDIDSDTNC